MITEIVQFNLPADITREEVTERFETTKSAWENNPDLVRKYYLFDAERKTGGGVYLWPNIEAAQAAHDDAWCDRVEGLYGSRPTFQYFETPLIVDNT